ncbi:MAG: hypothetical protein JNL67_08570 [Planctomycetaceae bacterium]|nr:hypothetical protein [Planctomycetaceae bacterium]
MPKVEPFERKELIDGLSGFGSREAAEAWEKKRTLSFYDQYGDDIVAVLIRERIPRAIISSYLKE